MPSEPAVYKSQLSNDPPIELLEWIIEGDDAEKSEAIKVLFLRYRKWLFGSLKRSISGCDENFVSDLVISTLAKAVEKASQFHQRDEEENDIQERRFKGWLKQIAKNLFCDTLRNRPVTTTQTDKFWEIVPSSDAAPFTDPPQNVEVEAVEAAMSELPERDCDILRADLYHRDINNPQAKLPRHILKELCDNFGTTAENIRQIRRRAKRKIREKLEAKGISYDPR